MLLLNGKWTAKHSATVNVLLEKLRMYKKVRVPRYDVPFTLDVDVRHDGYGGILCQDQRLVACTSKVWDVAPS